IRPADLSSPLGKQLTGAGTLTHMSPQQLRGEKPHAADDIYSLGATLYDLLTSRPPFYSGDIRSQVLEAPARSVEDRLADFDIQNEIPPAVSAMIMACL